MTWTNGIFAFYKDTWPFADLGYIDWLDEKKQTEENEKGKKANKQKNTKERWRHNPGLKKKEDGKRVQKRNRTQAQKTVKKKTGNLLIP